MGEHRRPIHWSAWNGHFRLSSTSVKSRPHIPADDGYVLAETLEATCGIEWATFVVLEKDARYLPRTKCSDVRALERAQLLDIETQGTGDAELHKRTLLVPALVQHFALNVVHDEPVQMRMVNARDGYGSMSAHIFHAGAF